jgi:hypothetical protein
MLILSCRLLDVLAQRKDSGEIYGSILIDGKPQGISFQRTTGYCEQMDVHEATATVREALEFSALLRQPSHVSRNEKIQYVDQIIELLELSDIQDALIGGEHIVSIHKSEPGKLIVRKFLVPVLVLSSAKELHWESNLWPNLHCCFLMSQLPVLMVNPHTTSFDSCES